jgi:hypothetical protein
VSDRLCDAVVDRERCKLRVRKPLAEGEGEAEGQSEAEGEPEPRDERDCEGVPEPEPLTRPLREELGVEEVEGHPE